MIDIELYQKIAEFEKDAQHLVTEAYMKSHVTISSLQSTDARRHELEIERAFIYRLLRGYTRGCNKVSDLLNSYLQEIQADNLTQIEMKEIFEQSREAQQQMDKVFQDQQNQSSQTSASC